MLAVLCPGQGAQTPGFLRAWLDVGGVRDVLQRLSTRAGVRLVDAGCDTSADVVDTAVAQPLIVATGVATAQLLGPLSGDVVVVGHSVGEITAAALCGVMTPAAAVDVARERGRAMATASAVTASGMVAVLGGEPERVTAAVERAGCWVANRNGAGQLVVAGPESALQRLMADPPDAARLRPLAVAGAFHTPLMEPARAVVAEFLAGLQPRPAERPFVSNGDGALVRDGAELAGRLAEQVTRPVRFDRCLDTLRRLGVSATIEVAPAGVLTNLVRRELPDVEAVALRSPQDLDAAHRVVAAHADAGEQWCERWQVLVAPATGTLQLQPEGTDALTAAVVRNRTGDVPVQREQDLRVLEWLAHDGDPVREGQPLARLTAAAR